VSAADGADGFGLIEQAADGFVNLVAQLLTTLCQVACQVVAFERLPEPFDRIEVGAVGGQVNRFDVVPVEALGFVSTRIVEQEHHTPAVLAWHLRAHRIEQGL
jgi:hypothetical protein